jgi:hypothetical protein
MDVTMNSPKIAALLQIMYHFGHESVFSLFILWGHLATLARDGVWIPKGTDFSTAQIYPRSLIH